MSTYTITERTANGGRRPEAYYLLGEYLFTESTRNPDGFFYAGHNKIKAATGIPRSTHGDYIAMLAEEGYLEVSHVNRRRFARWVGDINSFRANYAVDTQAGVDEIFLRIAEYLYAQATREGGIFRAGDEIATQVSVAAPTLEDYLADLTEMGYIRIYRVGTARFIEWIGDLDSLYDTPAVA